MEKKEETAMAAAAMAEMKEEGAEEFCLPEIELPVDSEGFTQSFDAHSIFGRENSSDETTLTSLSTFFAAYGFVVMRGVFSAEECEATRSAMWDILEAQVNSGVNSDSKKAAITTKKNKKKKALTEPPPPLPPTPSPLPPLPPSPHLINGSFDRAYPSTWHHLKPTGKYGLSTRGPTFEPLLVRNRQNPLLAKALAHIIEAESTEDVMVSHDRFTIYRATVFDDPSIEGKQFGTGRKNVHLDLNPWWWEEDSNDIISGRCMLYVRGCMVYVKSSMFVFMNATHIYTHTHSSPSSSLYPFTPPPLPHCIPSRQE